jgi:hypothetical protein
MIEFRKLPLETYPPPGVSAVELGNKHIRDGVESLGAVLEASGAFTSTAAQLMPLRARESADDALYCKGLGGCRDRMCDA